MLMKLIDSALRTGTMLALAGGFSMVAFSDADPQSRMTGTTLIIFGVLGALYMAFVHLFGSHKSTAAAPFKQPIKRLIAKKRLPSTSAMLANVERLALFAKPSAMQRKQSKFPMRGTEFASMFALEIVARLKLASIDEISDADLARIHVTFRIMCGDDEEVAKLAALLRAPQAALDLRKKKQEYDLEFERHDAARRDYLLAVSKWEVDGDITRYSEDEDLVGFLQDMPFRDVDLWHDIACQIDPGLPVDEEALLWITSQPDCDKATVAAFLDRYLSQGHLQRQVASEMKKRSTKLADHFAGMIERWNAGYYASEAINFETQNEIPSRECFDHQNAEIARMLGRPLWPTPKDIFRNFEGRDTDASCYFAYNIGLMVKPPQKSDFIIHAA